MSLVTQSCLYCSAFTVSSEHLRIPTAGSILIQGAHGVGRDRQRVDRRTQPVQAISGWPDTALEKAIDVLQHVYSLVKLAIRWAQSQRHLLEKWCAS